MALSQEIDARGEALPRAWELPSARRDDAPAVRAADALLAHAIERRASDVHLEPRGDGGCVRQRIDGVLRETAQLDADVYARVLSRIKLLAGMDITDRRLPQDGSHTVQTIHGAVDIRVASLPTIEGEKLVLRLLDRTRGVPNCRALGMDEATGAAFRAAVLSRSGFVVVCGPTGSGKTTTAYAAMLQRDLVAEHVCSVEDPVEVRLPGVAQVQVNVRVGLGFAAALRGLLRSDPNAVLVGEMRDPETAATALGAALCGLTVVTTLHSASALDALARLGDLGLARSHVSCALNAVVGQRLLRRICPQCRRGERAPMDACSNCAGQGYFGRIGVFEMLSVTPEVRRAIAHEADRERLLALARTCGYRPVCEPARVLVAAGVTSADEVERVLGSACA